MDTNWLKKHYGQVLADFRKQITTHETNAKYIRVLKNDLKNVLFEEIFNKMKTKSGRDDKKYMSSNINFLQKIVNKKSQLYTAVIKREFSSNKELAEWYIRNGHLDKNLQQASKFYSASKSVLVEMLYDRKYRPRFQPVANDSYWLWTSNKKDTTTPEVVVKLMGDKLEGGVKVPYLYLYTEQAFMEVAVTGKVYRVEENPLGFLPFVQVTSESDEIFPSADNDTLSSILQINSIFTDANVANYYQAFPIIVATDVDPTESDLQRNPNALWVLKTKGTGNTPTVSIVQSSLQTDKSVALAKAQLELIMDSQGLKVNSGNASANTSGIQELINAADITEIRKMMANDWAYAEEQLWEVIKLMHNWTVVNRLSELPPDFPRELFDEDFKVTVDFPLVDTTAQAIADVDLAKDNAAEGAAAGDTEDANAEE